MNGRVRMNIFKFRLAAEFFRAMNEIHFKISKVLMPKCYSAALGSKHSLVPRKIIDCASKSLIYLLDCVAARVFLIGRRQEFGRVFHSLGILIVITCFSASRFE